MFAKTDTPAEMTAELVAAFAEAAKAPDCVSLIEGRGFKMLSLSGAEAKTFLNDWQATTSWLVWDAGLAKTSPEEFGIVKP